MVRLPFIVIFACAAREPAHEHGFAPLPNKKKIWTVLVVSKIGECCFGK